MATLNITSRKILKPSALQRRYITYCETMPVDGSTVLFESYHGSNVSCSPFAMLRELRNRSGLKIYVTTHIDAYDKNQKVLNACGLNAHLVILNTDEYARVLATAKYLINNTSFHSFFIRRDEQVYLNTWHGTPLKTLGKNMKKGINSMFNIQHNFLQATHLLFPNEYTMDHIMEDYNIERLYTGKVVLSGYPRNAIFSDAEAREQTRRQLGLGDERVIVYMPTWRGTTSNEAAGMNNLQKVLGGLSDVLDDKTQLYISLHPTIKGSVDLSNYSGISFFPDTVAQYDFINCADLLITDYSSIFFDYSVTGKPIILYIDDYDEYTHDRGVYIDPRDMPFCIIDNIDDLCAAVKKNSLDLNYLEDESYVSTFIPYDSIDASKKLVDCIFDGKEDGLKVLDYAHNKERQLKVFVQPNKILDKDTYDRFLRDYLTDDSVLVTEKAYVVGQVNDWFYKEYNALGFPYVIFEPAVILNKEDWETLCRYDPEERDELNRVRKLYLKRELDRLLPGLRGCITVHDAKVAF